MERGRIQGLPKFFGYPLLSQQRVKLRTSNFVATFIGRPEQKPMKISGIVAVDVVRESRKFSGHPYVGRIARSSLRLHSFLVGVICQLPLLQEEFGIATLTFHSDLRRRTASRRALPCPSSPFCADPNITDLLQREHSEF